MVYPRPRRPPRVSALFQGLAPLFLALAGAVLAALVASYHRGRRAGTKDQRTRHAEETNERHENGRAHLARHRGDDPVERLRRNEGRWK